LSCPSCGDIWMLQKREETPIPTPETPPFEIENGLHVDCGGEVIYGNGVRAACQQCGCTETWKQAAMRLWRKLP